MNKLKNEKLRQKYLNEPYCLELFPKQIFDDAYLCECEKGKMIVQKGNKPNNLYVLVKGRCSVSSSNVKGDDFIINTYNAPCMIGEVELLDLRKREMDVKALCECYVLAFPLDKCRDILINNNSFLRKLCLNMVIKEKTATRQLSEFYTYPFLNRLAYFILNNSYNNVFTIKKVDIASFLGVSYRHCEKVMNDLVESKVLSKDKTKYKIINKKQLEKLANELIIENAN